MTAQLRDWQVPASDRIVDIQSRSPVSFDLSDTGTGKSYIAMDVCRRLGVKPLIITPKSVVTAFRMVAMDMGVQVLDVLNVEKLKTGKTPWARKDKKMPGGTAWTLPPESFVVIDEAHRFGGRESQNGDLLALTKPFGLRVHLMSATLADSPLRMRAPAYLSGLIPSYSKATFEAWCRQYGCFMRKLANGRNILQFTQGPVREAHLKDIRSGMQHLVARLRVSEIPGFPKCDLQSMIYDLEDKFTEEINKIYAEMDEEIARPKMSAPEIVHQLRARQRAELIKVPLMAELAEDALEEGHSPVFFVHFRQTLQNLREALKAHGVSVIYGDQKENRDEEIRKFQANENLVCIATSDAGGVGIGLHDLHGRPRISYITPGTKAVEMKQCLGRIWRDAAVSKAVQRFICIAGTIEERVHTALKRKLHNMELLNDGDLFPKE